MLTGLQQWAEAENERLAQNFTNAAAAYEAVDAQYKAGSTTRPPRALDPFTARTDGSTARASCHRRPRRRPTAAATSKVPRRTTDLNNGDQGASLILRRPTSRRPPVRRHPLEIRFPRSWEGEAADAARTR